MAYSVSPGESAGRCVSWTHADQDAGEPLILILQNTVEDGVGKRCRGVCHLQDDAVEADVDIARAHRRSRRGHGRVAPTWRRGPPGSGRTVHPDRELGAVPLHLQEVIGAETAVSLDSNVGAGIDTGYRLGITQCVDDSERLD